MYYSSNKICKIVGVSRAVFDQDVILEKIPDASLAIGKSWRYTEDEVKIIEKFYQGKPKRDVVTKANLRRKAGFYSVSDLGKVTGFSHFVIIYHIRQNHIPAPDCKVDNLSGLYYNYENAVKVVEKLSKFNGGKGGITFKTRKTLEEL